MKSENWWNTNDYIAGELVKCLDELIKNQNGYPGIFDRRSNKYSKTNERKWRNIMIEMRDGFKCYLDNPLFYIWKDGKEPPTPWFKFVKVSDDKSISEVTYDEKKYKFVKDTKSIKKFEKAKKLFVEYFDYLWD